MTLITKVSLEIRPSERVKVCYETTLFLASLGSRLLFCSSVPAGYIQKEKSVYQTTINNPSTLYQQHISFNKCGLKSDKVTR